ncbi:hypothetical protein SKAU_G00063790 [Synaphobranchus kaupii]|uniref:RecA family profile 1 domain-containing protein n=1 Tax=Synaphobranchus kaupii TaxID=118154 RepID=A0A9Q1G5E5_SYNKA|nr:hypothetical protein SKAU_G00063790 [Synaphobranchus kaupii]
MYTVYYGRQSPVHSCLQDLKEGDHWRILSLISSPKTVVQLKETWWSSMAGREQARPRRCTTLWPAASSQRRAGGLEVEVVFVDTDYHLDTLRLVAVLERHLPTGAEDTVQASLARLYVVHCSSAVQLLLTLHYLVGMFCSRPSLSALILDSISAFYWVDRANGGESLALQESNLRKCTKVLERLLKDNGIVVFATTHAIMRNYASEAADSSASSSRRRWSSAHTDLSKAYLCRAWQCIVTHRLYFSKGNATAGKPVFSITSSCSRTKSTRRCSFHVTDGGIQFL